MVFDRSGKIFALFSMLILGVMLSGCSENDGKAAKDDKNVADVTQPTKEQLVSQRALERWQALIAMDWEKAYEYFSQGSRELKSLAVFKNHMQSAPMLRKGAAMKNVKCEGDVCDVSIELTYIYMGSMDAMRGQETTSILKEKWLFLDDNWWYVDVATAKGFL
jgi:hypothetical protein